MKSKPLIKTHWLASQNPMNVTLAGLQRVVFCPPPQILNTEFVGADDERVDLPPLADLQILQPDEDEIKEVRSRSHTFSRDLFWTLFSGHDILGLKQPPTALLNLAQSIEFHFEDGQILSLIGIFRRPQFPLFLDPKFYLQDRSCNWSKALEELADDLMKPLQVSTAQKKTEDFKKAWLVVLEVLAWAFQRKRQVGDLEILWTAPSTDPQALRSGYPLQEIEFLKPRPLAATVMSVPQLKNTARVTVWQGLDDSIPSGILRFHSVGLLGELEGHFTQPHEISAEEAEILGKTHQNLQWKACLSTVEKDSKAIFKALHLVEIAVQKDQIFFIRHTLVEGKDFKPALKVRESEGSIQVAVSFQLPTLQLQQLNFPLSLRPLMAPFWGGIDVYFGLERKIVASRKNQFRAADLTLLRHQGLTLFCLLEILNWRLKKPLSSGESIDYISDLDSPEADRSFEKLVAYLKLSIPGLLGKVGTPFDVMFSSEVKSYFLDFLEKMFQAVTQDRSLIFHADQVAEVKNVQEQVLPLLRFLILYFSETSKGKFLTRAQAPIAESFRESLRAWTEPHIQPLGAVPEQEPRWVDIGLFNRYLISLLFDLSDHGTEVEFNGVPFLSHENPFEFSFSVGDAEMKEDSNLFDLHPQIFFNGTRIASDEVQLNFSPDHVGFIEYRGQMYRIDKKQIPTLKSLQRFWNRIKKTAGPERVNSFGEKVYQLEKSQALELLMLKAQGIKVEAKGQWKRIFDYFEQGLGTEKIELPEAMLKVLLQHQREGAQWLHDLYELKLGAILADEMGLGKTFQVLSFLSSLQTREQLKKSLIVVPTSLVYNWMDEKKKFAPDLPVQVFQSAELPRIREELLKDEPLVMIATYGLITENLGFFESQEWNVVVFDEAQNLKNITSLRSVSARKLRAQFKVCLTGTPMENHYLEFFSLCDLVVPGCLGDVDTFRKTYYNNEVRNESLRELRLVSRPLLLRRTKLQVKLSLPVKTLQKVLLPFGVRQKEIYKKMAMTFSRQVEDLIHEQGEKKAQIAMFAALMRLRQICSDPAAVPGVVFEERPVKVEHFLNSLQDHLENGESVIVFTQFLSTLGRIEKELQKMKVPAFVLQGSVSAKERLRLISAFQDSPEPGVMLMTLKTGGVGLNLTKASVVYHLEPWWNPAVENQATDRAHRMGQTKAVKVYNLLIEGSLEERIADLKIKKQGSFDRLFGTDEQIEDSSFEGVSGLSKEDFVYLLK